MMKTIEIVTHCWRFSRVLNYQLGSLVLHSTAPADVLITVFYAPDDRPTLDVIDFFRDMLQLRPWPLHKSQLLRRAIGRNLAAESTSAGVVWFCDADYYFGPRCLATLPAVPMEEGMIYFPRQQLISKTHELGDQYARRPTTPGIYTIDPDDFQPEKIRKAIGGLQIVTGETARRHGYCRNCRVQREVTDGSGWAMTLGDQVYRGESALNCGRGTAIELPNLYRIRQSQQGVVDTLPDVATPARSTC